MAQTNLERYGARNTFGKSSILFDQVQSYWDGRDRTAHLDKQNFARPEIKKRIKKYWFDNHGVTSGSQVPEIRAKQLATTKERFGDEQGLRVAQIREKGIETWKKKYGVSNPMHSPEILKSVEDSHLRRFGETRATKTEETQRKLKSVHFEKFGNWFGATDEWKRKFMEKLPETTAKIRATNLKRFGVDHFMKDPDRALAHFKRERRHVGPNGIESHLLFEFPMLFFTGDGKMWRRINGKNKNPDFCYPVTLYPDGRPDFHKVTHIVELFGDYWHGPLITGISRVEHERKFHDGWTGIGFKCLVIWESEMKKNMKSVRKKIRDFLGM